MPEPRHWHDVCLIMTMRNRVARLFTIKTRFEAFLVIFAIAMGAAERARHYIETYGLNASGLLLALCCSGVVFVAGGKLLDAVRRDQQDAQLQLFPMPAIAPAPQRRDRRRVSRNRPRSAPMSRAAVSRSLLRKD